jgi:hypothetical protein
MGESTTEINPNDQNISKTSWQVKGMFKLYAWASTHHTPFLGQPHFFLQANHVPTILQSHQGHDASQGSLSASSADGRSSA